MHHPLTLSLLAFAFSCTPPDDTSTDTDDTGLPDSDRVAPPPTFIAEQPARMVALADVHGDLEATRAALKLAGAIDDDDAWIGGDLVLVQTGDQIDRGPDDRAILDLFEDLADQALLTDGAVYALWGNHEVMNVELDLRYIHEDAWATFDDIEYDPDDADLASYSEEQRGRVAAFRPGGPYATLLAGRNGAMVVGDTAFVHGAILPEHAEYGIEVFNAEVQAWMRGEASQTGLILESESPVWARTYSEDPGIAECAQLEAALATLGAARLVVGHTVQDEANAACDGQVWRLDVGMSEYYGGSPAVLEITPDGVNVIE
jgi:hypothetical protein